MNRCILSTCWVLQIILYVLERQLGYREIDLFLNNMLSGAASAAPLFATFLYIIFAFYLFFCVIKGNSSLGMRVFFLTIHPLKVGDTLMSGLVFNAGVILAASMPIGQFLSLSFADYGMLTQNSCQCYSSVALICK